MHVLAGQASAAGRLSSKVTLLMPQRSLLLPIAASTVGKSWSLQSNMTTWSRAYADWHAEQVRPWEQGAPYWHPAWPLLTR